jgi:predicted RNA-binding Zn ribbon-like protein
VPVNRLDLHRPSLALTATVGGRDTASPQERLTSTAALAQWLATNGLRDRDAPPPTDGDLRRVRDLREAIHRLALATATGGPSAADDICTVNAEALTPPRMRLTADQRLTRSATTEGIDDVTALLARDAIDLLTGPHAAHLHVCAADGCATVFLDPTSHRNWCSTRCGTRARVTAHRRRQRTAAPRGG